MQNAIKISIIGSGNVGHHLAIELSKVGVAVTHISGHNTESDSELANSIGARVCEIENLPKDPAAIFEDPQFVDVAARGNGFEVLKNFMLMKISPLIDKGIYIQNNGDKDIFGNPISGLPDLGAIETK